MEISKETFVEHKAESLETKGLYRRAAQMWLEVMLKLHDKADQERAIQRHNDCIRKSKRPPLQRDNLSEISKAATSTQIRMGIKPKDGRGFNDPGNSHKK